MDAPPPARRGRATALILVVAGALLLGLGAWRLVVWATGPPEHYLLITRRETDEELEKVVQLLDRAKADLEAKEADLTRDQIQAERATIQNLEQIRKGMVLHREQDMEAAGGKELRIGYFGCLLGLALILAGVFGKALAGLVSPTRPR